MAILREGLERGLDGGQGRGVGVHGGSEAGSNDGLVGGLIDEGRENGRRRTDLTSPFFKWSMSICIPSARLTVSYWGGAEVASFWVVWRTFPQHSRRQCVHIGERYIGVKMSFPINDEGRTRSFAGRKERGL